METTEIPSTEKKGQFEGMTKVTPFSKYSAMALFVILPFLGAYFGYGYGLTTPRVDNGLVVDEDWFAQATPDTMYEIHFNESIPSRQFLSDDQVSGNYYVHQAAQEVKDKKLQLIDLEAMQQFGSSKATVRTVDNKVLTYLGTEYLVGNNFRYLPSPNGKHIFIDGSDECECDLRNEAILTWVNDNPVIIPLPNVSSFAWSGDGDQYTYTEVVHSPEVCKEVTGDICLPYTYKQNLSGDVSKFSGEFLQTWDGQKFE